MKPTNSRVRYVLYSIAVLLGVPISLFLYHTAPGGTGTLSHLELPDGSEFKISQRYNWSTEPYTVSFFMKSKGGNWGWCYIDHQAERWRDVMMTYDASTHNIMVTESGRLRARLDRKRNVFWTHTSGVSRETAAPQLDTGQGVPPPP